MIRRPPISTRTDTLFPYTTLFRSIVELLPSLRHRGLVGNGDHAHPTPELAQCVDHVERLRAAANLHYRKGPALSGAHPGLFQRQPVDLILRSEEHTSELQSLMRISYAVFCLKKKKIKIPTQSTYTNTC